MKDLTTVENSYVNALLSHNEEFQELAATASFNSYLGRVKEVILETKETKARNSFLESLSKIKTSNALTERIWNAIACGACVGMHKTNTAYKVR